MPRILYPRGSGAATGAVPPGCVEVHRWASWAEVRVWMDTEATHIPLGIGRDTRRVYVTWPGAVRPGGTGDHRIEFYIPAEALKDAGVGLMILDHWGNLPIYNVRIVCPD